MKVIDMKKILGLIFIICLGCNLVMGQQLPQMTQYMINNYAINPAIAGMHDYYQLQTNVRNQWVGLTDAPTTTVLSIYGRKTDHVGLGGIVFNDKFGPTTRIGGSLSYSYHFSLTENMKMSLALAGGFTQFKISMDNWRVKDLGDPVTQGGVIDAVPDATFGLNIYASNWYFGISVPQLLTNKIESVDADYVTDFETAIDAKLDRHYFALGAYNFGINSYMDIEPSFLLKSAVGVMQVDFGLKATYNDMLWMGINYRNNGDIGGLLGYSFQERYEIGYVYEMVNSELKTYAPVSHEFMIAIKFKPATEEELLFYK